MSTCRVISCVVGRGCLLWPVHSLDKTLLAFVLLHFLLKDQTCLLLQKSLDFLLLNSSPLWWKGHLFLVLVLWGLVELFNFSFFSIIGWSIDLDYYDTERFALEMNGDHSVCCIWDCTQVLHSNTNLGIAVKIFCRCSWHLQLFNLM